MSEPESPILRPAQAVYLASFPERRDSLLAEMEAYAREHDVPIAAPALGRLLEILARSSRARRILEVGTAIGYGTLRLARGAPDARVVSIDRDPESAAIAAAYLARAGVAERVELVTGEALEELERVPPPFDLVYIDADKLEYRRYLDLALGKLVVGGLVVVDNLLWSGKVADPPDDFESDEDELRTDALAAFNGYMMMHPQLDATILPLGDGIGLGTKTKPLVTDMGGPF